MNIGSFKPADGGFTGTLQTLTLNAKARFVPAEKKSSNAPDYRLLVGSVEVGAGLEEILQGRPALSRGHTR
jgi:uncharacterized protein (DUF736 family)